MCLGQVVFSILNNMCRLSAKGIAIIFITIVFNFRAPILYHVAVWVLLEIDSEMKLVFGVLARNTSGV